MEREEECQTARNGLTLAQNVPLGTGVGAYMIGKLTVIATLGLAGAAGVWAQQTPIYQVTVIEHTVKAVDYQYRNGPTKVDFRGTVLLPHAKGEAVVESKAGRTEISARFERVQAASRYGPEYLTY